MALIKCPECGRENVSDRAPACPGCGYVFFEQAKTGIKNEECKKNRKKRFIIPIIIIFLMIIVIISVSLFIFISKIPNKRRINECLEITEESIGEDGTIQEIYYYEPSNSCIILIKDSDGDEDQETVNLDEKTYGKRSTYALYAYTIELAEMYDKTEGIDILYEGIRDCGFDVLLSYKFDTNPEEFNLIYKNK